MTNGDFIRSMTDEDITENFTRGIGLMLKGWKSVVCLCPLTVSQTLSHGTSGRWMG